MQKTYAAVTLICAAMLAGTTHARGGHSSGHSYSHGSKAAPGVYRGAHGRIQRSHSARSQFQHTHPCPSTGKLSGSCPGYVIDHVTPLKRGGADSPSNMQWQTKEEAKIKDRTE